MGIIVVSFKPCYKWITFNTIKGVINMILNVNNVLNLVINGLPSILLKNGYVYTGPSEF